MSRPEGRVPGYGEHGDPWRSISFVRPRDVDAKGARRTERACEAETPPKSRRATSSAPLLRRKCRAHRRKRPHCPDRGVSRSALLSQMGGVVALPSSGRYLRQGPQRRHRNGPLAHCNSSRSLARGFTDNRMKTRAKDSQIGSFVIRLNYP